MMTRTLRTGRDPMADPADLACHHALSGTNHALNTAFTLLSDEERITLRAALGPKWFRYRVRLPLSRWRQLRAMQADGRLIVHGGVNAHATQDLSDIVAGLGADRLIPAIGQSSDLEEGPELLPALPRRVLSAADVGGPGHGRSRDMPGLYAQGLPRDDLLLIGQLSAGSYFTVSALDIVDLQARRAAQTIGDAITTRASRLVTARKAA